MTDLLWVDIETTGLYPELNHILEVSMFVTDADLRMITDPLNVIRSFDPAEWDFVVGNLLPAVNKMHTENGLLDKVYELSETQGDNQPDVALELASFTADYEGLPLAGSSVTFDKQFLDAHYPVATRPLHYRTIDVSTVKELAKRWNPTIEEGWYRALDAHPKTHRATEDLLTSLAELRFYRNALFTKQSRTFDFSQDLAQVELARLGLA